MCIVTEFIAGLLKFEFVFRRHIAGTEAEHVCDEYQSTNFLIILHDRSNEEEVVGFNVLAISAEELEVVISAKNILAENDLRALFSNCGLENLTSLSNEEIQEITVRSSPVYFAIVTSPSAVLTAGFSIQAFVVIIPVQSGEALSRRIGCLSSCPSGLKTREVSASGIACNTVNQTSNGIWCKGMLSAVRALSIDIRNRIGKDFFRIDRQRAASAVIHDQPDRCIGVAAHAAGKRADELSK